MSGQNTPERPGPAAAAAGPDVSECMREHLAEAIASIRWQAAVTLRLAHDPPRSAGPSSTSRVPALQCLQRHAQPAIPTDRGVQIDLRLRVTHEAPREQWTGQQDSLHGARPC
jgi:hypothetical protein